MDIFCFILVHAVKSDVCRKSLCAVFELVSEFSKKRHCLILCNIVLILCRNMTFKSGKKPAMKVLKLS